MPKSQYNYFHLLVYYWVVEGVECWLKRVIHWLILHILLWFASIYLDLLRFSNIYWDLLRFTEIYWDFTEIYWDVTDIYWVWLRLTTYNTVYLFSMKSLLLTFVSPFEANKSLEGWATLGAALKTKTIVGFIWGTFSIIKLPFKLQV